MEFRRWAGLCALSTVMAIAVASCATPEPSSLDASPTVFAEPAPREPLSADTPEPRITAAATPATQESPTDEDTGDSDSAPAGSGSGTVTVVPPSPSPEPAQAATGGSGSGGSGSGGGGNSGGSSSKGSGGSGTVTRTGTTVVVGDGSPSSCTSSALADAVRGGGDVSFNCGPDRLTITLSETLMTCNTHNCEHPWKGGDPVSHMTLDGGGLVTLSGGGSRGIFYANTCEESFGWLSSTCQNETVPHITFRNIGFVSGNASSTPPGVDTLPGGGGGGAIGMRGGKLTVQSAWFSSNRCMKSHSDAGGGAIRVTGMRGGATISNSTFTGNKCANGGAVSSLHASLRISGSTFTDNTATGSGASSGKGGNGGAVYFDGTSQDVSISGSTMTGNKAPEGGPAVFYVSNDGSGSLSIKDSTLTGNSGESFHTDPYRDIFFKGRSLSVSGGTVE